VGSNPTPSATERATCARSHHSDDEVLTASTTSAVPGDRSTISEQIHSQEALDVINHKNTAITLRVQFHRLFYG
jgi:hypothetical protein